MTFGNPDYLKALPLVALPLLLHLFYPRRRKIVLFAPFMLLLSRQSHPAIRRRLRELLLLLMRMLAIAFAVLALSRPHIHRFTLGTAMETGAVIILDDSMSMQRLQAGNGDAFSQARQNASAIIDALPEECRIGLVFTSGASGSSLISDREKLHAILDAAQVTGCSGSLSESLSAATEQMLALQPEGRQYFLVSDFQANALPSDGIPDLNGSHVYALNLGTSGGNCSISPVDTGLLPKIQGRPFHISATISNHSGTDRKLHVILEINGMLHDEQFLDIPPESNARADFIYTPASAGELEGKLTINDPEIPYDNTASFVVQVMDTIPVLLISETSGASSPLNYLRLALTRLAAQDGTGGFRISAVSPGEAIFPLDDYGLIAIVPTADMPAGMQERLAQYVQNGGRLMLFPANDPGTGSAFYDALAGAIQQPLYSKGEIPRADESGMECLDSLKNWNSLLEFSLIHWSALDTPAADGAQLLATNGGGALICLRHFGKGGLLVLGMRPNRSGGNWTELKSFPIMMISLSSQILGLEGRSLLLECGQSTKIRGETPELIQTDGHIRVLEDGNWEGTRIPGIIRFRHAQATCAVAMPPAGESIVECLAPKAVERRLNTKPIWLSSGRNPAEQLVALQEGTDITGLLLAAAVFAIAAEFIFGMSLMKKHRPKMPGI